MKNVLTAERIKALMKTTVGVDLDVVVHETIDSTNTWALQQCKTGKVLPFACFAEQQTAGKGRRGKTWLMAGGENIALSLAWPFVFPGQDLQLLSMSIAIAIAETLKSLNLQRVQIKWPNDVYVDGKKIAGVLIETKMLDDESESHGVDKRNSKGDNKKRLAVVIGIGLNYDMSALTSSTMNSTAATALVFTDICAALERQNCEIKPERVVVASILLQHVISACQEYAERSRLILSDFRRNYDYCFNKEVDIILDDQSIVSGLAKGVTDKAELIVEINGERRNFNSAEVSVRASDKCR